MSKWCDSRHWEAARPAVGCHAEETPRRSCARAEAPKGTQERERQLQLWGDNYPWRPHGMLHPHKPHSWQRTVPPQIQDPPAAEALVRVDRGRRWGGWLRHRPPMRLLYWEIKGTTETTPALASQSTPTHLLESAQVDAAQPVGHVLLSQHQASELAGEGASAHVQHRPSAVMGRRRVGGGHGSCSEVRHTAYDSLFRCARTYCTYSERAASESSARSARCIRHAD